MASTNVVRPLCSLLALPVCIAEVLGSDLPGLQCQLTSMDDVSVEDL